MSLLKRISAPFSPTGPPATAFERSATSPKLETGEKLSANDEESGSNAALTLVQDHWNNAKRVMYGEEKTRGVPEKAKQIVYSVKEIVSITGEERANENEIGPCLAYVLQENVFEQVNSWSSNHRSCMKEMKREQLMYYRDFLLQARQPVLLFEQVWDPLLRLLHVCSFKLPVELEEVFVSILHHLCICVNRDVSLIDPFFFHDKDSLKSSVLSLLTPYVHREENVGNMARDAVLLCMSLSADNERFGMYVAEDTNFCPVLAAGLSAFYSSLPTTFTIPSEDWYSLEHGFWVAIPELVSLLKSLELCNDVIRIAHPRVQAKLLALAHNGFLVNVMGPALHQNSTDELIAATSYLDLFLRNVTEPKLMKVFLKFLMLEEVDNVSLLDTLIQRIQTDSHLCMVSLGLFHTLLNLNCEDVLLQLVLRYLIPCTHLMPSQKRTITEVDLYSKSAAKFLSLIPACCSETTQAERKRLSQNPLFVPPEEEQHEADVHPGLLAYQGFFPAESLPEDYMFYLLDARVALAQSRNSCDCWSAPYDGTNPPVTDPNSESKELPEKPSKSSDAKAILHIKDGVETSSQVKSSLGPFLNALFTKLGNMPQNSFYINLMLTGVITRLAYYPQPLLRSFLLNYNMVLKPGVKSLFQILSSVKIKVENIVSKIDSLDSLLSRARKNLAERDDKCHGSGYGIKEEETRQERTSNQSITTPEKSKKETQEESPFEGAVRQNGFPLLKTPEKMPNTVVDMETRRASDVSLSPPFSPPVSRGVTKTGGRRRNPRALKNAIYCVVVLEEWLKELAAISQEHALAPPYEPIGFDLNVGL